MGCRHLFEIAKTAANEEDDMEDLPDVQSAIPA